MYTKLIPELNPFSYFAKHHQTCLKHEMVHLKSQSPECNLHHPNLHLQGRSPTRINKYAIRFSMLDDSFQYISVDVIVQK